MGYTWGWLIITDEGAIINCRGSQKFIHKALHAGESSVVLRRPWSGCYWLNLSPLVDASYPLAYYPTLKDCAQKVCRKKLAICWETLEFCN